MRLLVLLCAVVLGLGAAPALAQDPDPTQTPGATEQVEPEGTATPDDPIVEEDPYSTPGCEEADGTDTDYTYCGCSADSVGTEGDYVYCAAAVPGGGEPRSRARRRRTSGPRSRSREDAVSAVRTLPASLPLTGGSPLVIALIGVGFVLIGTGGRLRLRIAPGGRTQSG